MESVVVAIVLGAVLLAGIVLFVRGMRGKRVGEQPVCVRCGFDLRGRPEGSMVCAECGADLLPAGAIQIGQRVKRPKMIAMGGVLLLPSFLVIGVAGWAWMRGADWEKQKPAWLLVWEAKSNDAAARNAALTELVGRLKFGSLDNAQVAKVVAAGLEAQGDLKKPWSPEWGDMIESAHASGAVSAEQWKLYARQALGEFGSVQMRQKIRRGDPWPYRIRTTLARTGSGSSMTVHFNGEGLSVDGMDIQGQAFMGFGTGLSFGANGYVGSSIHLDKKTLDNLKDGKHTGEMRVRIDVGQGWSNSTAASLAQVDKRFPFEFTLLPSGESSVKAIQDASLRAAVEKSLDAYGLEVRSPWLNLMVRCNSSPVDLVFEVVLRDGKREWPMGEVSFLASGANSTSSYGTSYFFKPGETFTASTADVVLKPSAKAATNTVDVMSYWDGEVVIKGVKVQKQAPVASSPSSSSPSVK